MTRLLLAGALAIAGLLCVPAHAQVESRRGDIQVERSVPLDAAPAIAGASPDALYSNLATFRNQSIAAGGATQQFLNTITRLMADDLNLVGTPPYAINGFRFIVTNLNAVDVAASPLIRFYNPDGPGGGPGTLIAAFSYNPITFTAGRVGTIKTSTTFTLRTSRVWAGISFDNNGGTSGATAAQLDGLALGAFSPAALGTSADQYFITTAAGSFASDNPAGTLGNFGGAPPADFGWEILAQQSVDLSITNTDGVDTAPPGGSVVYTVIARNAGPDPVFNASVVDTFPAQLTCSWTCAAGAGNTCAASGIGNINDRTVSLLAGASVSYTATCAVASTATGTLVNTAAIVAPGTAVDGNLGNNTAIDTDAIVVRPPAVTVVTFVSLLPNPTQIGTATTATVQVATSPGNLPPTGRIDVILNSTGATLCSITLPATTCTFAPAQSGHTELLGRYSGDAAYPSGLSNVFVMGIAPVKPVMPNVSMTPNPAAVGTAVSVTSTVEKDPLFPAPTGMVLVRDTDATRTLCTITLPATSCAFTPTAAGSLRVDSLYGGDANYTSGFPPQSQVLLVVGIISAAPPGGSVGSAYAHTYRANAPFTYSVTSGALPPGLTLAADGVLSGTPATAGTFTGVTTGTTGTLGTTQAFSIVIGAVLPGAPTIGVATAGNAQATVAFTPPASNGGSAITSYTVTSSPAGITANGAASPITVSGLTNGTAYTFTVTATNAVGAGPASAPSNSVTPAAVPGAPTIGIATAGNAQATVAFTPPVAGGGSPITSYTVTSSPGGIVASGAASPITVSGLTNGTAYTFTVTATNAVGTGLPSAPSNSVTPATVPGAPTLAAALAGNTQAGVAFVPPASNGGAPITSYTVTSAPGGITASGPGSPIIVNGLTNGTAYTFTVTAINAAGTGPPSTPTNSVTPAAVPGAPTIGIATAGNAQATVAFTPPASTGGSPITSYTATSSPGGISASGAASPVTVNGLTNGTAYTFTVTATNAVGTGFASAPSNSVTPATVPGAPTIGAATPGIGQATIAFTPPASNGGSPITSYRVTCATFSATGAASPLTVTGLTNGTVYSCSVTATNAVGTGAPSVAVNVTPGAVPGAPTIGIATAGNGQATITFTPPASSGGSPIASYTVTSSPAGISASGPASPITVVGLTNGTAYTFTVTAANAVGAGPPSAPSNSVTPAALPGAPTIVAANAAFGRAIVAFTAPASDGGSPIRFYTATCGSFSASGAAQAIVVPGLTNGTTYSCTVTARNAVGVGPPSLPVNVTPAAVNRTYIAPSATGSGTIVAAFTGGGLTCTFATSNYIPVSGDTASPGTPPPSVIAFPHGLFDFTVDGCTPGSTITMTIVYPAALPAGTQYWKYGPEPGTPAPHWYVMPATVSGNQVVFSITDGGQGDDDLVVNGTIADQGGPGAPPGASAVGAIQTPTLSQLALVLMALMLIGFAAPRLRRKP